MGVAKGQSSLLPVFLIIVSTFFFVDSVNCIGVNYGTLANNLPPPPQVAKFLAEQTVIDRVKIFDVNPDIIRAFAGTGILLTVTVPNGEIPNLTNIQYARQWVVTNIKPFHPATKINYISVGSEVLHWGPQNLRDNLVAAMRSMYQALVLEGITDIKVSTPNALSILEVSEPPSMGKFRPGWDTGVLAPMLQFLRESKSPIMVNPYSYFGFDPRNLNFSIFLPNNGYYDKISRRHYSNRFDLLLDAVFMGMKRLGYADVEIVVTETGWPSAGDLPQCNAAAAAAYNGGLMRKYNSGSGTPLMPHKKFETYIFALFNENQKPGPLAEQNWGLFHPDLTPVYNVGVLKSQLPAAGQHTKKRPAPSTTKPAPQQGKIWCVPKAGVSDAALGSNINYVCGQKGISCTPIQQGQACFNPNTPRNHAAYVMNLWYQTKGHAAFNCDFSGTGVVTSVDPSYGQCRFSA